MLGAHYIGWFLSIQAIFLTTESFQNLLIAMIQSFNQIKLPIPHMTEEQIIAANRRLIETMERKISEVLGEI
jgi:hypothetical protein